METLILGAGATGGYFGGRMIDSGADVTFLVRPRRAQQLKERGLKIISGAGDLEVKDVRTCERPEKKFDLVIITCKAYDLDSAIEAIAPAVAESTVILPLLNGIGHYDRLRGEFGADNLIGGLCIIAATLDAEGQVRHLNDMHTVKYGEVSGEATERIERIDQMMRRAACNMVRSDSIMQDIWEKWVMIASLAALTTLMRASVGEIARAEGGEKLAREIFSECVSIATAHGYRPPVKFVETMGNRLVDRNSTLTASMLRDMEQGYRVEADQIIGDLIEKARERNVPAPSLEIAYCNLKTYEVRLAQT